MRANTPQELISKLMRGVEDGEPVVLFPVNREGLPRERAMAMPSRVRILSRSR